jgi:branched-chain amino acid transport system substrate-binding protein
VANSAAEHTVTRDHGSIDALKQARGAAAARAPVAPGSPTAVAPGDTSAIVPNGHTTASGPSAGATKTHTAAAAPAPTATAAVATGTAAASTACTTPLAPVAIGQVGTFSGVAGAITAPARTALAVWAKDVNGRGGLACHPVQVFATDDGADTSRAAVAEHDLVHQHHVVAFLDVVVPLTVGGFRPAVEADKVPVIGGVTGTDDFYESQWLFPEAASFSDQVVGLVRAGVERGMKRLGLLYCVEANACTGLANKAKEFAPRAGAELVYDAPVSLTQPDFTAQCINARNAKVNLLGAAMDGASITRMGAVLPSSRLQTADCHQRCTTDAGSGEG